MSFFFSYPRLGWTKEEVWQDARTRLSVNGYDPDNPRAPVGKLQWTPMVREVRFCLAVAVFEVFCSY